MSTKCITFNLQVYTHICKNITIKFLAKENSVYILARRRRRWRIDCKFNGNSGQKHRRSSSSSLVKVSRQRRKSDLG